MSLQPGRVITIIGALVVNCSAEEPLVRFEIRSMIPVVVNEWFGPPPPRRVGIQLRMLGPAASRVRAARVVVDSASDDFGTPLAQTSAPSYMHENLSFGPPAILLDRGLSFYLSGLARSARAIRSVEGKVEIIVPDLDPDATFVIANVRSKFGEPIQAKSLRDTGVTLSIQLNSSLDQEIHHLPGDDVVVGILDPNKNLIGFEFQSREGEPLVYDHGGFAHGRSPDGRRFDGYKIGPSLPNDARFVCWLATTKSRVTIPVKFSDIPLPDASQRPK